MTTLADLESLAPEWETLWQNDKTATPFQHPAWLIPWTKHLWGGGELILMEEREAGKLTGLLPLFRWGQDKTTVSLLGAGVSDYGGILGSFRNLQLPPDAILEEVRSPLAPCSNTPGAVTVRERLLTEPCSVCPVLELANYPQTLNPKLKQDLHRAQNKIAKQSPTYTQTTDPEVFLTLHAKRWNQSPEPKLQAFQTEVIQNFAARNLLRLHLLTLNRIPAAAIFAIKAHATLYCYLTAYDPQFTKLSPGAVLLAHAIEEAKSEGLQEVDFLRGPEPYKYLWGAKDRINYRVRPETNTAVSKAPPES